MKENGHTTINASLQLRIVAVFVLSLLPVTLPATESELPETIPNTTAVNAEKLIAIASKEDSLVLIDARLETDHRQGFIEGSISLPDTMTNCKTLNEIIENKNQPIIFYCNGPKCKRSNHSVLIAQECNYKNIYWFRGGIEEWKNKNYPFIPQSR